MSNHTWECPHGVEMGQGCCDACPVCDADTAMASARYDAVRTAFRDWEATGDNDDLVAGIGTLTSKARELEVRGREAWR